MNVRLWNAPYNGGWVWFARANINRFAWGRSGCRYWWAVFGFSGVFILQSWPWQKI